MAHSGGVADDIITIGGPGRAGDVGQAREPAQESAGETFESLFRAHYPRLVETALALGGDLEPAEKLAQQAFLRLWRRSRLAWPGGAQPGGKWTQDRQAAWLYLRRALLKVAPRDGAQGRSGNEPLGLDGYGERISGDRHGSAGGRVGMEAGRDALDGGRYGQDGSRDGLGGGWGQPEVGTESSGDSVDVGAREAIDLRRAWREFDALRSRAARNRRISLAAVAVVVVTGLAVGYPAITAQLRGHGRPMLRSAASPYGEPPAYPKAVVARIPVSGVISLAVDGTSAWAVSTITGLGKVQSYQLDRIDLRTNKVTLRVNVGSQPRAVAAAAGTVWLTTPFGRSRGQLAQLDPATGRVIRTLHLPGGQCDSISYSTTGYLLANCEISGPLATDFVRINPLNGQVAWQESAGPGQISSVAVAPRSVWYVINFMKIGTLIGASDATMPAVTTEDPAYQRSYDSTLSVAYGLGALWTLDDNESITRVSPATGIVQRVLTQRNGDPGSDGAPTALAVGSGSLWLLADGHPLSGVLQVNPHTGQQLGVVPVPAGACGHSPCSRIYATPGAVWVPTLEQLIRIDPARMRTPKRYPSSLHPR